MSKTAWIIFTTVCALLFGTLVVLSNGNKIDVSNVDVSKVQPASKDSGDIADNYTGNKYSKIVLVEYGDYQCPGCGSAYSNIKKLTDKYDDQIAFVYRSLPLTAIHPNSLLASATAESAAKQGKFWQMHDILYTRQSDWQTLPASTRTDRMVAYANELGLDEAKFRADIASPQVSQKIKFDQALAKKEKITGTPTFTLNGKLLDQNFKDGKIVPAGTSGAQPIWGDVEQFEKQILIPALKEAGIELPKE